MVQLFLPTQMKLIEQYILLPSQKNTFSLQWLPLTVEPLNVDTMKSGHYFFILSQYNRNMYIISPLKSGHLSNRGHSF